MMQNTNTHTPPPPHTGDRPAQWNASRYFYTKQFCLCRRWPLPTPRPRRHRQHTHARAGAGAACVHAPAAARVCFVLALRRAQGVIPTPVWLSHPFRVRLLCGSATHITILNLHPSPAPGTQSSFHQLCVLILMKRKGRGRASHPCACVSFLLCLCIRCNW